MKEKLNLRKEQALEAEAHQNLQQQAEAREFASVEEMLRFDAAQHPPPASLDQKVNQATAGQSPPLPWWKRWMGKKVG